jgi:hypothetical protein
VTADVLDDSSATLVGDVTRQLSAELDNGETYTFSLYLRSLDTATSRISLDHVGGLQGTDVLITWSTVPRRAPRLTRTDVGGGVHLATVVPAGNGLFRVSVPATSGSSTGSMRARVVPDATGATQNSVLAWGAQFENGQVMTPYQPVTGRFGFAPAESTVDPIKLAARATIVGAANDVSNTNAGSSIHDISLVQSVPSGLPPRRSTMIAAVRGSLVVVGRTGQPFVPRGGSGVLAQSARFVSMTTLQQRVFAVDGVNACVYEPARTGQVKPFVARRGTFPPVQLISSWRSRLFGARTAADPHAWFASAVGDAFDHDYYSPPLSTDKATFDGLSPAGSAPDAINTIFPINQNALGIGCDHAIWFLDGDPLAGGRWRKLSDITGMLFGNSWCKDPEEVLYFFGSRGGFYRMVPGGLPQSLTTESIERRLTNIDFGKYYVECRWNWRAEGIEIFVIPYDQSSAIVKHYFWGRRFNEWREDEHTIAGTQPAATCVVDGDNPNDRYLVSATYSGTLLRWSETEKNDDGNAIKAKELLGPYFPPGESEVRYRDLRVQLSNDSDSADFELYASDESDLLGPPLASGLLGPGRNEGDFSRVRGAYMWLMLKNERAGESFGFERATIVPSSAGRTRKR